MNRRVPFSSLKWTVFGQSGRSMGVKLDSPNDSKWEVCESGRSYCTEMDSPVNRKQPKGSKHHGLTRLKWNVLESRCR